MKIHPVPKKRVTDKLFKTVSFDTLIACSVRVGGGGLDERVFGKC